jgi:cyclopropane-fatty-acyl-phospholipid synthase
LLNTELEAFGGNLVKQQERKLEIVESLRGMPIAVETKAANEQHYELPTRFFELCLGPRLKYSWYA